MLLIAKNEGTECDQIDLYYEQEKNSLEEEIKE